MLSGWCLCVYLYSPIYLIAVQFVTIGQNPEPSPSTPILVTCVCSSLLWPFFCFKGDTFCEISLPTFLCNFYVPSHSHIHVAFQTCGFHCRNGKLLGGLFQFQSSCACNFLRCWIFNVLITGLLSGAIN